MIVGHHVSLHFSVFFQGILAGVQTDGNHLMLFGMCVERSYSVLQKLKLFVIEAGRLFWKLLSTSCRTNNSLFYLRIYLPSLYQQTQLLEIFWEIVITLWMLLWILRWNGEPIFRHVAWFWISWLSLLVLYRRQLFCVCQNQKATLRPSVHSNLLVTGYRCYCIQILRPRWLFKTRKKKEIADCAERLDHYI